MSTITDRFWSKVNKDVPADECWLWVGPTDKEGYGKLNVGRTFRAMAHRYSYTINVGDPGQLQVCHSCDNPTCVNPAHLFLGTNQQNMLDARTKGRFMRLTELEVRQIKIMHFVLHHDKNKIMKDFNISQSSLDDILSGRSWSSVVVV